VGLSELELKSYSASKTPLLA